jgi:hypothetical protein
VLFDLVLGSAVKGGKGAGAHVLGLCHKRTVSYNRAKTQAGATPTQVSYYQNVSREDANSVARLCTAYHDSNVVNFRNPVVNLALVAKPVLHEGWLPTSLRQVPNLEKECSVLGLDIKDIQGEKEYNVTPMPAAHKNESILCQVLARLKGGFPGITPPWVTPAGHLCAVLLCVPRSGKTQTSTAHLDSAGGCNALLGLLDNTCYALWHFSRFSCGVIRGTGHC